jgi:hypothetical protein
MPGQYLGNPNGGMTVYYIQPPSGTVTAFKKVLCVTSDGKILLRLLL